MKPTGWRRLVIAVVLVSLVAAACGDGKSKSKSSTATKNTGGGAPANVKTDDGVTKDTIRLGMIADLSGIFAPLVTEIVEAQKVYFEMVNDNGGIAGRKVQLVIEDNGYDVTKHKEIYERMRVKGENGVVWFTEMTGSPHTASVAQELVADNLGAIPLTWYSGWADPSLGKNVFEFQTNYCVEAMNGIEYLAKKQGKKKLAILSFPGEYGQDGAEGAKKAAKALGLDIVYDGEAKVVPGADQTPVIAALVGSGADLVWTTINPTALTEIMGGASARGFNATWSGNYPSYSFKLLSTELAPLLAKSYVYSAYTQLWGGTAPGIKKLVAEFQKRRPNAPISDNYIRGWAEAMATHQILERAAKNGDMTRAGVLAAARQVTVDFEGLAPNQSWGSNDMNENVVRESYLYDIDNTKFKITKVTDPSGSTGSVPLVGPYVSETAKKFDFTQPCFKA